MTHYDFNIQRQIGEAGEAFLDRYFGSSFHIQRATATEQRAGIDRHFRDLQTGERFSVEYKTDQIAARSHNAFIEVVSVDTTGRLGWAYTSKADILIYYVTGDEVIYFIPFKRLRAVLPGWAGRYPRKKVPNSGYNSWGLPVPLEALERVAAHVFSA